MARAQPKMSDQGSVHEEAARMDGLLVHGGADCDRCLRAKSAPPVLAPEVIT